MSRAVIGDPHAPNGASVRWRDFTDPYRHRRDKPGDAGGGRDLRRARPIYPRRPHQDFAHAPTGATYAFDPTVNYELFVVLAGGTNRSADLVCSGLCIRSLTRSVRFYRVLGQAPKGKRPSSTGAAEEAPNRPGSHRSRPKAHPPTLRRFSGTRPRSRRASETWTPPCPSKRMPETLAPR